MIGILLTTLVMAQQTKEDYAAMRAMALSLNKPLIVGIGMEPPRNQGLSVKVSLPFGVFQEPCIVRTFPKDGELCWTASSVEMKNRQRAFQPRTIIRASAGNC